MFISVLRFSIIETQIHKTHTHSHIHKSGILAIEYEYRHLLCSLIRSRTIHIYSHVIAVRALKRAVTRRLCTCVDGFVVVGPLHSLQTTLPIVTSRPDDRLYTCATFCVIVQMYNSQAMHASCISITPAMSTACVFDTNTCSCPPCLCVCACCDCGVNTSIRTFAMP